MMIMELLCWIFGVFGFTQIIVESEIFKPFRIFVKNIPLLGHLFNCFLCVSVWIGGFMSYFVYSPTINIFDYKIDYLYVLVDAMIASTLVWLLHCIELKLELYAPLEKQSFKSN